MGPQRRWYSNVIYNTVPQVSSVLVIVWSSLSIDLSRQVFERIKTVTSSDIVAEVGSGRSWLRDRGDLAANSDGESRVVGVGAIRGGKDDLNAMRTFGRAISWRQRKCLSACYSLGRSLLRC